MGTIIGRRIEAQQAEHAERVPPTRNRYQFYFMSHPWRWAFDREDLDAGGDGWLPSLGRLNRIPGVGGINATGGTDLAAVQAQRAGWSVIFDTDPRLGNYAQYVQEFPTRGKVGVYGSLFDSVSIIGNRAIWKHDDEGFRVFRRYLVDKGIVAPITEEIREQRIDDARSRLEQMRGRLAAHPNNPALARRIELAEEQIGLMLGEPEAAPEPPKRGRKEATA